MTWAAQLNSEQRWVLLGFGAWLIITVMWWLLAFAPLPLPDESLARFRAVCFGAQPNGLPNAGGWLQLVLGPLGALSLLLVVWGDALSQGLKVLWSKRLGRSLAMVVVVLLAYGLGNVANRVVRTMAGEPLEFAEVPAALPSDYPRLNMATPDFSLIDQRGQTFDPAALSGNESIVTFAYAHCQTVCPMIVRTSKAAAAQVEGAPPRLVVLTLDPWRDTPASLPTLVKQWELEQMSNLHVLSGPVTAVNETLIAFNTASARDSKTGEIAHPALVYVLDRDGNIVYGFNNPTPAWIAAAVERLRAKSKS